MTSGDPTITWYEPGEPVEIKGYLIPDGMIYVGHGLKNGSWDYDDVIDSTLAIIPRKEYRDAGRRTAWPSYQHLSPQGRADYLRWLSEGRRGPLADPVSIALFLAGLERRVTINPGSFDVEDTELLAIHREIVELVRTYRNAYFGFQHLAFELTDRLEVILNHRAGRPFQLPELIPEPFGIPTTLQLALGGFAQRGEPIPAEFAFAWCWFHPNMKNRNAAIHCSDEYRRLFEMRFTAIYRGGFIVIPGKSKVRSPFARTKYGRGDRRYRFPVVPDISHLWEPFSRLQPIYDAAAFDLDYYSRWIGRNPDGAGTIAAIAQLPDDFLTDSTGKIREFRDWIERQIDRSDLVRIPGSELLHRWNPTVSDKLTERESSSLASLLRKLGYGIEPDVELGGLPITAKSGAVIFRRSRDAPEDLSEAALRAKTLMQLATVVFTAGGERSHYKFARLVEYFQPRPELTSSELLRLTAYREWISAAGIGFNGLTKRLYGSDEREIRFLGETTVSIVAATGAVLPEEITALKKVYKFLLLDPDVVPSDVHLAMTGSSQPAAVSKRTPEPVQLDPALVRVKQRESEAIGKTLERIFADEIEFVAAAQTKADGLDTAHLKLMQELAMRENWSLEDISILAREHNLMPDGAIDALNEFALEIAGDLLLDGDDELSVNAGVLRELLNG